MGRPRNGRDFFVMLGTRKDRKRWLLARRYRFPNGGSRKKHWKALERLAQGDRVFAYVAGHGYVGIGIVTGKMRNIRDAIVEGEEGRLIDKPGVDRHFKNAAALYGRDDIEVVVPVKWISETCDFEEAFWEPGTDLFGDETQPAN